MKGTGLSIHLETLLALLAIQPAPLTATGRLHVASRRVLQQRLRTWQTRIDEISTRDRKPEQAGQASTASPEMDRHFDWLLSVAEALRLIGPVSGRLRPLPNAPAFLAMSAEQQDAALQAILPRLKLLPAQTSDGARTPAALFPIGIPQDGPAANELLHLDADLSLRDGPHTRAGARFALASWAEWNEVGACLQLTEASVARAAGPLRAMGQDAAGLLTARLIELAEPKPNAPQNLKLHSWCVGRSGADGNTGKPRKPAVPGRGTDAWRLAALRLLEALAQSVSGIAAPPPEASQGLADEDGSEAQAAALAAEWLAAVQAAVTGVGLPAGVDPLLLDAAEAALSLGEDLHLRYRTGEAAESWRQVTPLRLEWHRGRLLLVAHCHLRGAERRFRMDRVLEFRPANGWPAAEGRPL